MKVSKENDVITIDFQGASLYNKKRLGCMLTTIEGLRLVGIDKSIGNAEFGVHVPYHIIFDREATIEANELHSVNSKDETLVVIVKDVMKKSFKRWLICKLISL
jgi:hypothetical protein